MTSALAVGFVIVLQVLSISLVSLLLMIAHSRSPSTGYAVGVAGLVAMLCCPVGVILLPSRGWHWRPYLHDRDSSEAAAVSDLLWTEATGVTIEGAESTQPYSPIEKESNRSGNPQSAGKVFATVAVPFVFQRYVLYGIVAIWLSGVYLRLVWLWRRHAALHEVLRRCRKLSFQEIPDECRWAMKQVLGNRPLPEALSSDDVTVPFVAGLRTPKFVVPGWLLEPDSGDTLRNVVVHECAHIARRDLWVGAMEEAVAILYWPHPFLYMLLHRLARLREEVCDNFVLSQSEPWKYAEDLVRVSQFPLADLPLTSALMRLGAMKWTLSQRVEGILAPSRRVATSASRMSVAFGLLAMAVCVYLTGGISFAAESIEGIRHKSTLPKEFQPRLVHGIVVDAQGQGVVGASLAIRFTDYPGKVLTYESISETDGTGAFHISVPDRYQHGQSNLVVDHSAMLVYKAGFQVEIVDYHAKVVSGPEPHIQLQRGPEDVYIVHDPDDDLPIEGVLVTRVGSPPLPDSLQFLRVGRTNHAGRLELPQMPPGYDRCVSVTAEPFGEQLFQLPDQDRRVFNLRLQHTGTLRVHVSGGTADTASVEYGVDPLTAYAVRTEPIDQRGIATFERLPPGLVHRITLHSSGPFIKDKYLFPPQGIDGFDPTYNILVGQRIDIHISMAPAVRIHVRGRLLEKDTERGVSGAQVHIASSEEYGGEWVWTDADGRFEGNATHRLEEVTSEIRVGPVPKPYVVKESIYRFKVASEVEIPSIYVEKLP